MKYEDAKRKCHVEPQPKSDPVENPPHYTHGSIEPISVIEDWRLGFCLGNVVKYLARADHKGSPIADMKKARWYLDREIAARERAEQLAAAERYPALRSGR